MLLEDYKFMNKTLFCEKCAETKTYLNGVSSEKNADFVAGYLIGFDDQIEHCPYCKNTALKSIPISNDDFLCLRDVSNCNKNLLKAMIELVEKDPIEYELKMSHFRTQAQQQKTIGIQSENAVCCPYCHSKNTAKITTTAKVVNTAVFGIFGTKRHKQWHCNNCKSDF